MLPDIRQNEHLLKIPHLDLKQDDVEGFLSELKMFQENFDDCFYRSELRGHFSRYMIGQFSGLERKSIEPIAHAVEGGRLRAMQRFVSDAEWNEHKIESKYRKLAMEDLGDPNGALLFDETCFVKKGKDSIGVAKQYCGSIGKVENCQIGVFAAYVSSQGYSLIDKRLYLPQKWFTDEYEERRNKCNLPKDIEFKTKPQLAAEMLTNITQEGIVPFKYVLADSIYGENPDFIETVESLPDITYFVSIGSAYLCWLKPPISVKKEYKYRGNVRTKTVLIAD